MKLWLLKPLRPFTGWAANYDISIWFIVRAENNSEARYFASLRSGDLYTLSNPWLSEDETSCEVLTEDGGYSFN
jgi:hypothetical protein